VIPLRTLDGVEGVLTLAWAPERMMSFRSVDVQMAERFVAQAALALQITRGRDDHEKLAVFEDRDRIARDLHDLVIQRLFAIGLSLENTARRAPDGDVRTRVVSAIDDIDETIREIRRSIFALSVSSESTELRATVVQLVERAAQLLGFRPVVRFEGPVDSYVTPELATHVLAVLGEALSNTARHAGAEHVWVHVSAGRGLVLTAQDDGRGIPPGVVRSGLRNMQERAEGLGGTCTIETPDGGGTMITWSVPRRSRADGGPRSRAEEAERTSPPGSGGPSVGA
jgi:signal transduction histidine kinase